MNFDAAHILHVMPQRYPMLLIDRFEALPDPERGLAFKNITLNEPCYQHVQGTPVADEMLAYPLALLLESFGQGVGLLLSQQGFLAQTQEQWAVVFGEFIGVEVKGEAYPGDRLRHEIKLDLVSATMAVASGETRVGERSIVSYRSVKVFRVPHATLVRELSDA
ncbi:hotdog family protein [Collimonas humicola]|uniref:hypothetical protein n=1 Tax=Collimonas humicola TaxID=2825886 RepID=UPI001B8BB9D2|nr:hypothetical protein [Collimonas humicola]